MGLPYVNLFGLALDLNLLEVVKLELLLSLVIRFRVRQNTLCTVFGGRAS